MMIVERVDFFPKVLYAVVATEYPYNGRTVWG
jgi:hypothetical protein